MANNRFVVAAMNRAPVKDRVFTLRLSTETYEELQALADARKLKVADLLRMFIRLGMIAVTDSPASPRLMLKDGDELRPILLI